MHQETADPLDASEPEIVTPQEMKNNDPPEFVEMSMEPNQMIAKPEPDYGEDLQETENVEDDSHYVEDDAYGGETTKYEESYLTEGDDTKAGVSGLMDSYSQDQTDAQG